MFLPPTSKKKCFADCTLVGRQILTRGYILKFSFKNENGILYTFF